MLERTCTQSGKSLCAVIWKSFSWTQTVLEFKNWKIYVSGVQDFQGTLRIRRELKIFKAPGTRAWNWRFSKLLLGPAMSFFGSARDILLSVTLHVRKHLVWGSVNLRQSMKGYYKNWLGGEHLTERKADHFVHSALEKGCAGQTM